MEQLIYNKIKEKVFLVLLSEIDIEEFEKWLYDQNEIIDLIDEDSFIYDLVILNYKHIDVKKRLEELVFKIFVYEEYVVLLIGKYCEAIIAKDEWKDIYDLLCEIDKFIDFEKNYHLLWDFYSIHSRVGLIQMGYQSSADIIVELKELSSALVNNLKQLKTTEERIKFLHEGY